MHSLEYIWNRTAELRPLWRLLLKMTIFSIVLFFSLNPHPKRFVQQVQRYFQTEHLIQEDFPGIEEINREIDLLLPPNVTQQEEFLAVQNYVYQHIAYEYDWDNWGNIDFWPKADIVWARQREDCDGRAVLAASILRSRGFHSATLAGSIRHIWVQVDQQELMNPDTEQNVRLDGGKLAISLPSSQLLLESTALYVANFPTIRNLLLFFVALLLCYHPSRNLAQFFGIATLGLVGFILFKDWAQDVNDGKLHGMNIYFFGGTLLLGASFACALIVSALSRRKAREFRFCHAAEK
ncbi:MAG: transglutaminase domain-containing protein [bacterium]|nr:transglutaminase domain-containing protein [bacterium]